MVRWRFSLQNRRIHGAQYGGLSPWLQLRQDHWNLLGGWEAVLGDRWVLLGGWGALMALRKGRATSVRACLPGQHRLRLGIRAEISLEPLVLDQFVEGHIVPPALGITGERFVHDAALQRTVH